MILDPVAKRYAHALFEAAAARAVLDRVGEDLSATADYLATEARARELLAAPLLAVSERQALAARLFDGRVHPLVGELLHLLLEKRRFGLLADVRLAFAERLDDDRGIQRAHVTSAVALPEDLVQRLRSALALLTGKTIVLERRIDGRLLGGLRVQLGDEVIERSVRRTLDDLRATLRAVEMNAT
jgi:F-type H+-transporting ATPase subunit delta